MKFAKQTNNGISAGEFSQLWPNVTAYYERDYANSHGFAGVMNWIDHDPNTHKLKSCLVYALNGGFYDVEVVPLTQQEIDEAIAKNRAEMVCSMRQARLALLQIGKLSQAISTIESMSEQERLKAMIEWEYSTEVQRTNHLVQTLGPLLGLDDLALDNLYAVAVTL